MNVLKTHFYHFGFCFKHHGHTSGVTEHRVLVLQNLLNTLFNDCTDWDFEINVEKTISKKGGSLEMLVKHVIRKRGHLIVK